MNIKSLPSTYAFKRSIETTNASMRSVSNEGVEHDIVQYFLRHRTPKAHNEEKKDSNDVTTAGVNEKNNSNIVEGNIASLDKDHSVLSVSFASAIINIKNSMETSGNPEVYTATKNLLNLICVDPELGFVSRAFAYNILSGLPLWRNRDCSRSVSAKVEVFSGKVKIDEIYLLEVRTLPKYAMVTPEQLENGKTHPCLRKDIPEIEILANHIKSGFVDDSKLIELRVNYKVTMSKGSQIYPSQLFLDKQPKTLFTFGKGVDYPVGMTSDKINNAIRTCDVFHGSGVEEPIPFGAFGGYVPTSNNLRNVGKNDLRTMLLKALNDLQSLSSSEKFYLIGCLICGGIYNGLSKKDVASTKKSEKLTNKNTEIPPDIIIT